MESLLSKLTMVHILLFNTAFGGLPVSYPNTKLKWTGGKGIVPYNLIDAYPSCYARGICPMFPPGGRLSAFPNSEEKFQMIMHNLFRNWANETLKLKYAKWAWAASKTGGLTAYCKGCKYCGETHTDKSPLYWYSDANQAARFKQYDENSCNQSWYYLEGISAHHTCNMVLPEYGGGSNCDLFSGSCSMAMRSYAFCEEDDCWFETEGICAANTCVTDGHCDAIFANKYDYQGAGFVEGMNGAATTYSRRTKEIFNLLPMASHFDERMKVVSDERNNDRMFFTLMLQYFDANHTQMPVACYSLFKGEYHEMNVTVSEVGDFHSGYSINSYSVMFTSAHKPIQKACHPYAFICKTTANNFVRLPEDGNYYFGTEWIDWKWSNYAKWKYYCKENHYYYDGTQWVVNGDPQLDRCEIWYYQSTEGADYKNRTTCEGCKRIEQLDCWATCIYSDFAEEDCQCESVSGPFYGNEFCPPGTYPTKAPTQPSEAPTSSPTPAPVTSAAPTLKPTQSPLGINETHAPSVAPTLRPSLSPFYPLVPRPPTSAPTAAPKHVGGAGTAVGVVIFLMVLAVVVFIYWKLHDDEGQGRILVPIHSDVSEAELDGDSDSSSSNSNDSENSAEHSAARLLQSAGSN